MNKFCHLSLHSEFSINDGLINMEALANKSSELGFDSVALTDSSNLSGLLIFMKV